VQIAALGTRDPNKDNKTKIKGIPALACLAAGAGAGMMSLVSSFYDVGAIEMMMMQVLGRYSMLQCVAVYCNALLLG